MVNNGEGMSSRFQIGGRKCLVQLVFMRLFLPLQDNFHTEELIKSCGDWKDLNAREKCVLNLDCMPFEGYRQEKLQVKLINRISVQYINTTSFQGFVKKRKFWVLDLRQREMRLFFFFFFGFYSPHPTPLCFLSSTIKATVYYFKTHSNNLLFTFV